MQDLWYVRRENRVKGPFPCKTIARSIEHGQLFATDEVSPDGSHWTALTSWQRQFSAAANAAPDPRSEHGQGAAQSCQKPVEQRPPLIVGNAGPASGSARLAARQKRRAQYIAGLLNRRENRARQIAVIVGSVTAVFIAVAVFAPRTVTEPPQCQAAPRPGINWNNCPLETRDISGMDLSASDLRNAKLRDATLMGSKLNESNLAYANMVNANVSYTDLSGASLVGANLQRADLSYANLRGADLAYADLTGANIGGAELKESRLDHAIWTDGRVCGPGSVGRCAAQ